MARAIIRCHKRDSFSSRNCRSLASLLAECSLKMKNQRLFKSLLTHCQVCDVSNDVAVIKIESFFLKVYINNLVLGLICVWNSGFCEVLFLFFYQRRKIVLRQFSKWGELVLKIDIWNLGCKQSHRNSNSRKYTLSVASKN